MFASSVLDSAKRGSCGVTQLDRGFGRDLLLVARCMCYLPSCVANLLSIRLSIDSDIIRHSESPTTADHTVRQRFNDFLPDFLLPFGRLISVRSVVQLYPGP